MLPGICVTIVGIIVTLTSFSCRIASWLFGSLLNATFFCKDSNIVNIHPLFPMNVSCITKLEKFSNISTTLNRPM